MASIKQIQEKVGRFKLKKKLAGLDRNVKAFNLEKASKIGVLYNATNREDAELVKKFVQYLKEERKEVISLGYINSKDASEMVKTHLNYTYFDNKGLSKIQIPNTPDALSFMSTSFSVLIDMNRLDCFPLEYIASLSNAKFKVGASGNYRDAACDLILDIPKDEGLDYYIIQVKHYLQMIN